MRTPPDAAGRDQSPQRKQQAGQGVDRGIGAAPPPDQPADDPDEKGLGGTDRAAPELAPDGHGQAIFATRPLPFPSAPVIQAVGMLAGPANRAAVPRGETQP